MNMEGKWDEFVVKMVESRAKMDEPVAKIVESVAKMEEAGVKPGRIQGENGMKME